MVFTFRNFLFATLAILLVISGFLVLANRGEAYPILRQDTSAALDPERTVVLDQPITAGTLAPIYALFKKLLVDPNTTTINIIIDSPGGEVISGFALINQVAALQDRGIRVDCYVQDVAASMAFQLLTQCSKRYTLNNSFLLWHGVRTGTAGPITTLVAQSLAEDLARMDSTVLEQLNESLELKPEEIRKHFDRETLWSGSQLHAVSPAFITPARSFPEVTKVLGSEKVTRAASPQMFRFFGGSALGGGTIETYDRNQMYYIWSRYEYLLFNVTIQVEGK